MASVVPKAEDGQGAPIGALLATLLAVDQTSAYGVIAPVARPIVEIGHQPCNAGRKTLDVLPFFKSLSFLQPGTTRVLVAQRLR